MVADLSDERQEEVGRRFDYLDGALQRMGRRDWLICAVGVLSGIGLGYLIPEVAKEVWHFAASAFNQIADKIPGFILKERLLP